MRINNRNQLALFKLLIKLLVVLSLLIIFWTLWNLSIELFLAILFVIIFSVIPKTKIMCKFFKCTPSNKISGNIVRCSRCNAPMYRVK